MPRPKKTDRPIEKSVNLPESIVAQVEIHLFSELEGKVPFGAWSELMKGLLKEWLEKKHGG